MIRIGLIITCFLGLMLTLQASEKTVIGAQVYIEPGQTPQQIEHFFRLLKSHRMQVCRIRMDESHMRDAMGQFDFSLYQMAFDEAEKNGVAVFATLFPANVLSDANSASGVGGFKFPESEAHLQSIERYVQAVVNQFKSHPALKAWVLQNEPGVAGNMPDNAYAHARFAQWRQHRDPLPAYNGFMQIRYDKEAFVRDYTTWYMQWLANEVRKYDPHHELHLNPHMIFSNLADYDFPAWQQFLSHLGASMHPSWHFGYFNRNEYPLAMSANCAIIRSGATPLPFWITELQGGNNNFSGYNPLMPSREEIAQWMWTGLSSGAKGIIFWTLNPRATGFEAGEWALIDFKSQPTDRLQMAGEIAALLHSKPDLQQLTPLNDPIYLLYSPESVVLQRHSVIRSPDVREHFMARDEAGHIKSLLAFYRVFEQRGIGTHLYNMDQFDWQADPAGKTVILANMAIIPRKYYPLLQQFVSGGGRLVVTGQTGHYDEYVYNVMFGSWPLQSLFGASLKEFRARENRFDLPVGGETLQAHFLQGVIVPEGAQVLGTNHRGEAIAVKHAFGKGEVIWVPSMIGLAAWEKTETGFVNFVLYTCKPSLSSHPLEASTNPRGVLIKHFKGALGDYSLVINKSGGQQTFQWQNGYTFQQLIFHLKQPVVKARSITLEPDDCVVVQWERKF